MDSPIEYTVNEHRTFLADYPCVICAGGEVVGKKQPIISFCGYATHAFHLKCVQDWLKKHGSYEERCGVRLSDEKKSKKEKIRYLTATTYYMHARRRGQEEDEAFCARPKMLHVAIAALIGCAFIFLQPLHLYSTCRSDRRLKWAEEAEKTKTFVAQEPLFLELERGLEEEEHREEQLFHLSGLTEHQFASSRKNYFVRQQSSIFDPTLFQQTGEAPLLKDLLDWKETTPQCQLYPPITFKREPFRIYTQPPQSFFNFYASIPDFYPKDPGVKLLNHLYRLVLQQDWIAMSSEEDQRGKERLLALGGKHISLVEIAGCFSRLNANFTGHIGKAIRSKAALKFLETARCPGAESLAAIRTISERSLPTEEPLQRPSPFQRKVRDKNHRKHHSPSKSF